MILMSIGFKFRFDSNKLKKVNIKNQSNIIRISRGKLERIAKK